MKNYFYCYSYKLMKFLKLQDEHYIYKGRHSNGNQYWVFKSNSKLNDSLDKWNIYKKEATFQKYEKWPF